MKKRLKTLVFKPLGWQVSSNQLGISSTIVQAGRLKGLHTNLKARKRHCLRAFSFFSISTYCKDYRLSREQTGEQVFKSGEQYLCSQNRLNNLIIKCLRW